jgi:hypothetical protein
MQVPILSGIYTDAGPDFRTAHPRNLMPVPKAQGISTGYLRPVEGVSTFATGPGIDRGAITWKGVMYRVMGSQLVRVDASGAITAIGNVGAGGQVTMDYSFDHLGIASAGCLFLYDGTTLKQVTDPDLGNVLDMRWIAGYWLTTDGTNLVVTELTDPFSVNPLKYGSAESDPDPVMATDELRNEAYALGRYTIEVFRNVGGTGFPFALIDGAHVPRGIIGTHAYCPFKSSFAFVGSARNEPPAVWVMVPGDTLKVSTREVDQILAGYTEQQLAACVVESVVDKNHELLLIHLPDQCLVYDANATQVLGELIWHTRTSSVVGLGTYRARNFTWAYNRWLCGDPTTTKLGAVAAGISSHYEQVNGWDFGTLVLYADGNSAIVHELELVALTGRVAAGVDPVIWTSYSPDGQTWSQERPTRAGRQGQRAQRICWRTQGKIEPWRIQRFRGTTDAHLSFVRLEVQTEPLFTRPSNGR